MTEHTLTWSYRGQCWTAAKAAVDHFNAGLLPTRQLGTGVVRRAAIAAYRERVNGIEAVVKALEGVLEPEFRMARDELLELQEW